MKETGIGRLLVASLHQAISEILPTRLEFYEHWLNSDGFRHGRIGLAPLGAVLSFLREEGEAYDRVTVRAGELSADWTVQGLSPFKVTVVESLPNWLRARVVGWLARGIASRVYLASRSSVRWRRQTAVMSIRPSVFCGVRGHVVTPLCRFYAAALARLLARFALTGDVRVTSCRAAGGDACAVTACVGHASGAQQAERASVVMFAMLLALCLASTVSAAGQTRVSAADTMLVVPFDNLNREARLYWLEEAAAVTLTDDLQALGAQAFSRDDRLRAFERLSLPATALVTRATVIKVAELLGAARVVTGSVAVNDNVLTVRARHLHLEAGRAQEEIVERGALADWFAVFDRVARRVRPPSPTGPAAAATHSHPPIQAFEGYIKGLLAETPATQVTLFENALALHPSYEVARLALWDAYTNQGDHRRALTAALAIRQASPVYPRAQFAAALSHIALAQYEQAFDTLKAGVDQTPTAAALNNLGVVQLRRGATPQTGVPTYYFTRAADADPDDPDYAFNLGYAYAVDRDLPAATYWLREALRRNAADPDAHSVLAWTLQANGATAEAARERELADRLSAGTGEAKQAPAAAAKPPDPKGNARPAKDAAVTIKPPAADVLPRGLERLKETAEPSRSRIDSVIVATEQRDQQELVEFYLERGRRLFLAGNDREATMEFKRAVYLAPYQAEAHLLLGRIYLRANRTREAIDELKISLWSQNSVAAHVALGEAYVQAQDEDGARAELQRALTFDPNSVEAKQLLERLSGK
jgi:tetratricopeptide (TPR) repeat protein